MTGRVNFTPEAERHLNEIDDWIAAAASPDVARDFVTAVLRHVDHILLYPHAGRPRDDVRPGMRTTTFAKRTVVAYSVTGPEDAPVVTVVGIFHGGQDWEAALRNA
jgi:plasmid stabilization system protein ParE